MQTNEKDKEKNFPKVLLLGNGINICNGCERWSDFLLIIRDKKFDMDVKTLKSPMPLQAVLISNNTIDEKLKEKSKKLLPSQKLVCDNFPVRAENFFAVDFGKNERGAFVHSERARIIYDDRAAFCKKRRVI